ncbi:MAG: hypothetical protein IRY96_10870, partial [Burkholderiales bacterium]|nr:hypothetical protein [Burkholderiales bacterium]
MTIYDPRTGTWGHWVTLTDRDRYLHVFISEKGKHRHHRSRSENPYSQYTLAELEEAIRLLEETIAGYEAEVKAFKADKSMAEVPSIITRVQKIGGIRPPRRGQAFYV